MAVETQLLLGVVNGLAFGLIIALIASGLSLVFGILRVVNLAHGELYMLGAFIGWFAANHFGGFLAALTLSPLLVGAVGLAVERSVLRPLNYSPEKTMLATIGVLFIIQHGVLALFGPTPRAMEPPIDFIVQMHGFGYSGYRILAAAASLVLAATLGVLIYRTNFGLFLRASQQNRELALVSGVNVKQVYTLTLGLSSSLAAVGAVLASPLLAIHYLMGLDVLVFSFIVVIVGGIGSLKGTLVAAVSLGMMEGVLSVFFTPVVARMISLLLLAGVLVVKPEGMFGGGLSRGS